MRAVAKKNVWSVTVAVLLVVIGLMNPVSAAVAGDAPAGPSPVVRGVVAGIDGEPLARVRVFYFDEARGRDVVVRTDDRGRYRIAVPRPRSTRQLIVRAGRGYKSVPRYLKGRRSGGPVRLDVRLKSIRTYSASVQSAPRRTTVRVVTRTRVAGAKRKGTLRITYRAQDGKRRTARAAIGSSGVRTVALPQVASGRQRLQVAVGANADTLATRGNVFATTR